MFTLQHPNNAVVDPTVTIRIYGLAHTLVSLSIIKQGADFTDNKVVIGTHQMHGAALQCLGAFGGVSHHEHRFAQTGGLFLDATSVGEHNGALLHQIDEL